VIESFSARLCGLDGDIQIFFDFILTDEFLQALRAKFKFKRGIIFDRSGRDQAVFQRRVVFRGGH
jgi:hypothetical protein